MVEVRYVPAAGSEGWRAAVSAQAIAVLSPAVTPQTAEAVWRRLDGGGIGALVEALTGAFGTSLTAIPPFALVVVEDDGVRVAVRGPLDVVIESATGGAEVSGRGVATWAERLVPKPRRVTIVPGPSGASGSSGRGASGAGGSADGRGGGAGAIDDALALPIASGVVPVDGIVLTTGAPRPAAVAAPPAAAPAPRAEPAPESEPAPIPEPTAVAIAEPSAPAPAETTTSGEPSGADTWIPSLTQLPVDEVSAAEVPAVEVPAVEMPAGVPADDSTVATPGRGGTEWAATVVREAVPTDAAVPAGDHDGATISVAEARRLRAEQSPFAPDSSGGSSAPSPFEPVGDVPPRSPARGRARLSTGRVIELERPVVIGRRPRSTRASSTELPTLVAVESPEGDISRSHIEIRAEGEHVLVTDLATTNGTVLRRGGQDPVRLHPNEPTMVVTGDVLDLGDGVTVTFEDLP